MTIWDDTPLAAELLRELRRLTDEFEHRISDGQPLPGLASLQAISSRCEDLSGWVQHLIQEGMEPPDGSAPDDLVGAGLYL